MVEYTCVCGVQFDDELIHAMNHEKYSITHFYYCNDTKMPITDGVY